MCKSEGANVSIYPGIKISELTKQICMKQDEENEPEIIAIHVGTNNITKKRAKIHLVDEIDGLINEVQENWGKAKWVVGGLVYKNNVYDSTIDKLNDGIQWLSEEKGAIFYDPNSRLTKTDKARDGLHLNRSGGLKLGKLIIEKIEEAMLLNLDEVTK